MQVEFKPIDWSAKEAELNGKRVDVLWNGLTITEERKKNISFTAPYMANHQIIIVGSASPIKTKADLAGKVVGAQEGSSAVDAIKKDAPVAASLKEIKTFADNVTALMDLAAGRLDAIVVDEVVGRYLASKREGQYRVLEENFGTEDYGGRAQGRHRAARQAGQDPGVDEGRRHGRPHRHPVVRRQHHQ